MLSGSVTEHNSLGVAMLVIFDCDGVLVDSENLSNGVLAEMLAEQGLGMSTAEARAAFQGMRLDEVLAAAERMLGRALPPDWIERYERRRTIVFRADLQAIEGAASAVQAIQGAGVRVCVASQGKLEKTSLSLQLTGLAPLFAEATRFSAYSVPRGKPSPDLFLHAAASMGAEPAACVVVEDTPSGVLGAARANMRAIGYAADADARALRAAGAAATIDAMADLPPLLGIA